MVAKWSWSFKESQYKDSTIKLVLLREGETMKICTKYTHKCTLPSQTDTQIYNGSTPQNLFLAQITIQGGSRLEAEGAGYGCQRTIQ